MTSLRISVSDAVWSGLEQQRPVCVPPPGKTLANGASEADSQAHTGGTPSGRLANRPAGNGPRNATGGPLHKAHSLHQTPPRFKPRIASAALSAALW